MNITIEGFRLHITEANKPTMDALLETFMIPRKLRYQLYQKGCIYRNAICIQKNQAICEEDLIEIEMPMEEDGLIPWEQDLQVVYEDALFLIVDKPVGMLIHSDGINETRTLHNIVKAYYVRKNLPCPVRALHRLDVETSGLVIYCKLPFFQPMLDQLLQEKKIQRIYLGIVAGTMPKKPRWIEKPIGRDRHDAKKMGVFPSGAYAATKIIPRKQLKDATLVECHLKTGRTHQIRVHLASIGHPLLSDSLYGKKDARIDRCALHAWRVQLYHPILQKQIEVECEMPIDMLNIVKKQA